MKKFVIFLAFASLAYVSLGQRTFTEGSLKEMFTEYKSDSKAFFINRLSEDFRYINSQGEFLHKADVAAAGKTVVVATSDAQKILTTLQAIERMLENTLANDILEPIIFQSSDLAVMSGIQKTGDHETVACTHTFQKRKGKWIFVASQQTSLAE